jgi:sulfatase modifying factor 1
VSGSFTYAVVDGRADWPVNFVGFYDTLRFANWMNNHQGNGSTESGAYTLLGGAPVPSNAATISRSSGATWFLPSENEWYKAAYYETTSHTYFTYPTGRNDIPVPSAPSAVNPPSS